jgi:hypothetical protein
MNYKEKIKHIVDSQLEKLLKVSDSKVLLTDKDIRSLTELAKLVDESDKLIVDTSKSELESLTPEELLLIYEHRKKKKEAP